MAANARQHDLASLRKCVSAGEALPAATRKLWKDATGIEIIDGIGATEMFHIFISHDEAHAKPGATGTDRAGLPRCGDGRRRATGAAGHGRPARGQGADRLPLPRRRPAAQVRAVTAGTTPATRIRSTSDGLLPLPGAHRRHDHQRRLQHRRTRSRGRAAAASGGRRVRRHRRADDERGQIVKAFVVLKPGFVPGEAMTRELQDHVKRAIAPYKYPRAIEYLPALPRTRDRQAAAVPAATAGTLIAARPDARRRAGGGIPRAGAR